MPTTLDGIGALQVHQPRDGYRFSADAVFLASFVRMPHARRIIDLGAGAGVIGLLLSLRYPDAKVTLVELQGALHALAARNISINGLGGRVEAMRADIRGLPPGLQGYDLAVSNPPFRRPGTGLLSEGDERRIARHEIALSLPELLSCARSVLRTGGRFAFIHLPERLSEIMTGLHGVGLEPKRIRFIHGRRRAQARMVLIEAVLGARSGLAVEPPLIVYRDDGAHTKEVRAIYGTGPP